MKNFIYLLMLVPLAAQQPAGAPKLDIGDDKRGYTDTPQLPNQKWKVHDMARPPSWDSAL